MTLTAKYHFVHKKDCHVMDRYNEYICNCKIYFPKLNFGKKLDDFFAFVRLIQSSKFNANYRPQ